MGVKVDFKVNVPHGEMDITENGQYDVSDYAIANVNVDNKEQICNAEVTIPIDNLKEAINNYSNIWVDDTNGLKDFIIAQQGKIKLTINTLIGALYMTLYPTLWKDDTNGSYNYQGSLYIEQDLSAIGGSDYNQIVVRAIAWDNSKYVAFRPTIIPVEKQSSGGGKYSNHLHYDIHLEGTWDTSNQIMTFDTATQNAVKALLDKLDELTVSDNYDFLVNMRVAGKASAEGDIALIGANMKLNYIPGTCAVRNLQTQFILNVNNPDTAKIVITNTDFSSNNESFYSFITGMYVVFQFDINY
jgi:hypothetical protein